MPEKFITVESEYRTFFARSFPMVKIGSAQEKEVKRIFMAGYLLAIGIPFREDLEKLSHKEKGELHVLLAEEAKHIIETDLRSRGIIR